MKNILKLANQPLVAGLLVILVIMLVGSQSASLGASGTRFPNGITSGGTLTASSGDLFVGAASSTACLKLRDSDDAGWSYMTILNGTVTATTTSCE